MFIHTYIHMYVCMPTLHFQLLCCVDSKFNVYLLNISVSYRNVFTDYLY